MAVDSPSSSSSSLCQETRPLCPKCGSTTLIKEPENAGTSELRSMSFTGDNYGTQQRISDSDAFSRVLIVAISRMSAIAEETVQKKRLLTKDRDAMIGILENVCLMKSTISYLLREMYGKDWGSSSEAEDHDPPSAEHGVLICADDDDGGGCGGSWDAFEDKSIDGQEDDDDSSHGGI